jgi:hypothetical protein
MLATITNLKAFFIILFIIFLLSIIAQKLFILFFIIVGVINEKGITNVILIII